MKPTLNCPGSETTLADTVTKAIVSDASDQARQPRDVRFWLVFLGIGISVMITALELVRHPTVRTSSAQLTSHSQQFRWRSLPSYRIFMGRRSSGSAPRIRSQEQLSYPLVAASLRCACVEKHPETLRLTTIQIFGRRIVILSSLTIMALGSALCGSAKTMTSLIAGRGVLAYLTWRASHTLTHPHSCSRPRGRRHLHYDGHHCLRPRPSKRAWPLQWSYWNVCRLLATSPRMRQ